MKKGYASMPKDVKKLEGRNELAFGEVTGHAHRSLVGELFETRKGELYLRNEKLDKLSHEEHRTIELTPGCRHIAIKRQATEAGWEQVSD